MYDEIEELLDQLKGKDYVILMGDFNAVVGEGCDSGGDGVQTWSRYKKWERWKISWILKTDENGCYKHMV